MTQRSFDPSTACGPANPYPQKIIRGFEPAGQQNTFMQPMQNSVAGNRSIEFGGRGIGFPPFSGSEKKPMAADLIEPFGATPRLQSSGSNLFEQLPRLSYAAPQVPRSPTPIPKGSQLAPLSCMLPSPSKSRMFPASTSFSPRAEAFENKVKKTVTTSAAKAQPDAGKWKYHKLEEELQKYVEQVKVLPSQPAKPNGSFDLEDDLIDLGYDFESKTDEGDASTSDSEWSIV